MSHDREPTGGPWDGAAPAWDREADGWERVVEPVARWLAAALRPAPGDTLLELCAGPGAAGLALAAAVAPGGTVVVSDASPAMVEAAERRRRAGEVANATCAVLDAQRIGLADDAVDGILCRFGLMLLDDPASALAEMLRVLRPGGRLALAVWGAREANPWTTIPTAVAVARGILPPAPDAGPGMFALADADRLCGLVRAAGFADVQVEPVALLRRAPSFADLWASTVDMSVGLRTALAEAGAGEATALAAAVEGAFEPFTAPDGSLAVPGVALAARARRPGATS